jgi:hypothetical protein
LFDGFWQPVLYMNRGVMIYIWLLLLLSAAADVVAQKPLGTWQDGIATNYGGTQDGMDPYAPSFGTKVVSTSD